MTNLATRWTLLDAACNDVASAMWRRLRNSIAPPEEAVHEWENEGGNVAPSADALNRVPANPPGPADPSRLIDQTVR